MKKLISLWLLALLSLTGIAADSAAPQATLEAAKTEEAPVFIFPLSGAVDPAKEMFLRRALKDAERARASVFVIDMDTPGGRLDVTMDILEVLRKTTVPVVSYINPSAGSAGALISLGTKKIFMRKDAVIGAAAVITGEGADLQKTLKQKTDSFYTAKMRAVAEENGYNPDIAEAFMVTEKELKIGEVVIDSKETLLSLNGGEAVKKYDGKPLLASGLAETVDDLLRSQGYNGPVTRVVPTGFENVAFWLTTLSPLLLLLGIAGGYIEMKAPGFGIPGIVSLVAFALFFLGHYVAALTGWEATIVFVLGAILVIVEIFLMPGMIIPGLVGAMMIFGSIIWAMVDHWPSQPGSVGAVDFERPLFNFLIALGGAAVFSALVAKYLPHTSFYRRLVLDGASEMHEAGTDSAYTSRVKQGDIGVASTTLRPAGKAMFGEEMVDVVGDGEFIASGAKVRVLHVEGTKVVVELAS
jgi:membrane-bound serine protease (ClpP class)